MQLTPQELLELYEAVVKTSGHPDPLGYMTRALLTSEGDPDYIDVEGKQGFMPVLASDAAEQVGASEVQSLQANVIATLAMDMGLFAEFEDINAMIAAFHFGEDLASEQPYTGDVKAFISDVDEGREETLELMYPPLATVEDVIKLIEDSTDVTNLTAEREKFFSFLLTG